MQLINKENRIFYDNYWLDTKLFDPETWPHFKIIKKYSSANGKILEIGPGNRPKVPIKSSYFLDISKVSNKKLKERGGVVRDFNIDEKLPFSDSFIQLVCAFEVLEHVKDALKLLKEIERVLSPKGYLITSFPINMKYWNIYDKTVGHYKRFEPDKIEDMFELAGFKLTKFATIDISWPNKITGYFFTLILKAFPKIFFGIQDMIDKSSFSTLKKEIKLSDWDNNSFRTLFNSTTVFLVAKKS